VRTSVPNAIRLPDFLVGTVFLLGTLSLVAALAHGGASDFAGIITIAALAVLCERLSVRLYFDGRLSISFMGIVFAALWFGPAATAVVTSVVAISCFAFGDRSVRKLLFNFGQQNIAGLTASLAVSAARISAHSDTPLVVAGGGAMVGGVIWAMTTSAVAIIMAVTSGRPVLRIHRENFAWMLPHYVILGAVSGGLALVYGRLGVFGMLVLSAPVVLSRYSMKQVVDKTRENVLRLEKSNGELKLAHVEITGMSEKIREAYDGTLESLVAALDLRDHETRGHSGRVATHSLELAKMLGIKDTDELEMIYRGALMHDVGKIGIPDHILLKPGKLTEEEWEFMRRHSAMGYRILAQVPYLRPAAKVVLAHHERWDGGGYPRGLKGEDIPLGARIFAISDSFDAIISDRPYRDGQSPDAALAEIKKYAGSQFDPLVVEAFEAAFPGWREETLAARKTLYLPDYAERKAS
jgi:hypothetical protein